MQPQSEKTLIERFLEWWRGLTGQSGGDRGSLTRTDVDNRTGQAGDQAESGATGTGLGAKLGSAADDAKSRAQGAVGDVQSGAGSAIDGARSQFGDVADRARSNVDQAANAAQTRLDDSTQDMSDSVSGLQRELSNADLGPVAGDIDAEPSQRTSADNLGERTSDQSGVSGSTGASYDEFSTGGYTPENIDQDDVEAAGGAEVGDAGDRGTDDTDRIDVESGKASQGQEYANSGNYGEGNLGRGSKGSLGTEEPGSATSETADTDTGSDRNAASDDDIATSGGTDTARPLGTIGTEASTTEDLEIDSVGDMDATELGSAENLEPTGVDDQAEIGTVSASDLVSGEQGALADIGAEPDDFTSAATQDQGMRIADEDDPGITIGKETEDTFGTESSLDHGVDSGTDVEAAAASSLDEVEGEVTDLAVDGTPVPGAERPGDAIDSAALSDAEFETPGVPDEFGGDSANLDLPSAEDETPASVSNEELGAAGELGATEFGSIDEPGRAADDSGTGELDYVGLFGTSESDIEVTDLSYLDEAENDRFDFSTMSAGAATTSSEDQAQSGGDSADTADGATDDIGASPTGVQDDEGVVASELDDTSEPELARPEEGYDSTEMSSEDVPASATVIDDIGASPTGVQDTGGTVGATTGTSGERDVANSSIVAEPAEGTGATGIAAPPSGPGATAEATGPGGSVRGDGSGGCPTGYPIKGNASSKIYHVPGIASYRGTKAEWCFASEEDAISAGYRAPGQRNRGGGSAGPAAATRPSDSSSSSGSNQGTATAASAGAATDTGAEYGEVGTSGSVDSSPEASTLTDTGAEYGATAAGQDGDGEVAGERSEFEIDAPLSATLEPGSDDGTGIDSAAGQEDTDAGAADTADASLLDAPRSSPGDEFGIGSDDMDSLAKSPPDDVASEYASASADGGDVVNAGAGLSAQPEMQADVDSALTDAPAAAQKGEAATTAAEDGFAGAVRGDGTKVCPTDHPIKGNAGSMIYHTPGRASYDATIPEWCFATEQDAENAGFRAPKR